MAKTSIVATIGPVSNNSATLKALAAAGMAALIYLGIGNVLFKRTSAPVYERSITAFIAAYGVVILARTYL
ncbi:hypothetical protein OL229_00850 [Neisseriaceae bacterium JH1-16]|nr:hypothetical protein [Neisseriaceae bacterium JH1-16]